MSAGNTNQEGASASSSCQSLGDPARVLSLKDGSLVETHWITKTREVKFSFAWTIKDFSLREESVSTALESPTFPSGPNGELEWRLNVYPKGNYDTSRRENGCLGVHLKLVTCGWKTVPTKFEISILNDKNEKTHKRAFKSNMQNGLQGSLEHVKLDLLLNKTNGLLPGDNLTIFCEGTTRLDEVYMPPLFRQPQLEDSKRALFEDFGSLFENQEFSDFTVSVSGHDLPVHKAILAARSSVFAVMLKHEMEENKLNRVIIEGINYEVLREMLLYIYTGKLQNLEKMASDLLAAADKYNVSGLKEMCEATLCSTVTTENAVELLVLADIYSAKQLKAQVIHFISMRTKDVMRTTGWKNMTENNLPVFAQLFEAVFSK